MAEPTTATPRPLLEQLGARALRRAEPRASIAVAGAGCALAVLGVLIISGDTGIGDRGELNRWPGVILCAAVTVAGYVVMSQVPRGAIATGGAVAAALGVPPLMFFLTWDGDGLPPYSTEGILGVATLAWLATYLVGPGRGRPFFLGAGLIGLWATVMQVTEDLFDVPYAFFGAWTATMGTFDEDGFLVESPSVFEPPDPTTLGMLTLVLGVAYLVIARVLDGSGRHGAATPFAAATLPLVVAGPLFLSDELEAAGTGLLYVALGLALALNGAVSGRRATTWVGGAAVGLGTAVFLTEMTEDATVGGMLFLAAGIGLVFAAHAYASARSEADEMLVTGVPMAGTGVRTYPTVWGDPPAGGIATSAPPPPPAAPDHPGAGVSAASTPTPGSHDPDLSPPPPPVPPPPPGPPGPPSARRSSDDPQWAPPDDRPPPRP